MTTLAGPASPPGTPYDEPLAPGGPSGPSGPRTGLLVHLTDLEVRRGGRPVVSGVDLQVRSGEVVGLVGRNGAGKTTVLRALLGLLPVARGTVWSRDPSSVGVAFDTVSFPPSWSAREGLRCLGDYLGLDSRTASQVESVLDRVGLPEATRDRHLSSLSHGMRQMVSLAAALVGSPRLIVLDEPHNGLDPLAVHALGRVLRELADEGRGVLVSSHLIDEMDRVCDRVALLHQGRIVLDQRVDELSTCQGWYVEAGDPEDLLDRVRTLGHTANRLDDGVLVDLTTLPGVASLAAALVRAGVPVCVLRPVRRTLVDVVHTVLGGGEAVMRTTVVPGRRSTVLGAELRRAAGSRGTAALLVVAVVTTVLIGYVAVHSLLGLVEDGGSDLGGVDGRLADLSPDHLRVGMAGVLTGSLPVLALLSGGLVVRADYRGHLLRLLVGRGVSRTTVATGNVVTLAAVSVVASTLTAAAGLCASVLLSDRSPTPWPAAGDLATVLGVGALSWFAWGLTGLFAAVALRSSHAAVALAVVWLFAGGVTSALSARDDVLGTLAGLSPATAAHEVLVGSPGLSALAIVLVTPVVLGAGCLGLMRWAPVD